MEEKIITNHQFCAAESIATLSPDQTVQHFMQHILRKLQSLLTQTFVYHTCYAHSYL